MMLDEMDKLGAGFHGDPSAAPCWKFSTPSKMQLSATTTSPCHSISRRSCSSARPMWSTIFHPPCATGRKSSRCPATSRMRSWQSQKRYLVRRQLASAGLTEEQCKINEGVLLVIIRDYTREAGVRNLERQIGAICRHFAMRIAEGSATRVDIAVTDLQVILGSKRFEQEIAMRTSVPGVATGLAWTPAGAIFCSLRRPAFLAVAS
jgi:ATP-dependent Lon protease